MRTLDIVLLVLVQIIWGANYAVQKDAIEAFRCCWSGSAISSSPAC
jgi:hypothetical protein